MMKIVNQPPNRSRRMTAKKETLRGDVMMTIIDRDKMDGNFPGAISPFAEWLIRRDEQLAGRLAANVEVRRRSMESDSFHRGKGRSGTPVTQARERELLHFWSALTKGLRKLVDVSVWAPNSAKRRQEASALAPAGRLPDNRYVQF